MVSDWETVRGELSTGGMYTIMFSPGLLELWLASTLSTVLTARPSWSGDSSTLPESAAGMLRGVRYTTWDLTVKSSGNRARNGSTDSQ